MTEADGELTARSTDVPALRRAMAALLRADFITQRRNGRSWLLTLFLPLVFLFAISVGKRGAQIGPPGFRVATAITIGMLSVAVFGYSLSVAKDRDAGVFQRLRVAPVPAWAIMASRVLVHMVFVLGMAIVVLIAAAIFIPLRLGAGEYLLTLVVVLFASVEFLGIGQALAGLLRSSDTVNALGRLVFAPLLLLSIFGHSIVLGTAIEMVSRWSPGGVVETMLSGAMQPATWGLETWGSLLASIAYAAIFAGLGIRFFRWVGR